MRKYAALIPILLLGACSVQVSGLVPIQPSPFGGRADSLAPTLKWKELPWKDNPQISEITYDLKVLLPKGTPIYSREGLAACEHTLESPLEPGTTYLWTMRARFRWNGERRQTQWSHLSNALGRGPLTPEAMDVYWPLQAPSDR